MQIICPSCNAEYIIPDKKLPAAKALAKCKRCDGSITIDPTKIVSYDKAAATPEGSLPAASTPKTAEQRTSTPIEAADLRKIIDVYPELQAVAKDKFDLPSILTPTKRGGYKTGKNKYKIRILKAVQAKVEQILDHGEIVMRIGKGTAYYPLELFLGNGWLTMLYNHYAILCTNRRILFVNINYRMSRSTHYLFQLPYTDIKKVKRGMLFNHLILYRHYGKRRIFNAVKGYINKELRAFIEKMQTASNATAPESGSNEKLCPSCFVPLPDKLKNCPKCSAGFKGPQTALVRSFILPGLGDMYLGHRALGALEMLGSIVVWLLVVSSLLAGGVENYVVAAMILVFYNGLDGLLTFHMAQKGYMLAAPKTAAAR